MAFSRVVLFTLLAVAGAENSLEQQQDMLALHKMLDARSSKGSFNQYNNASATSPRLMRNSDCFTKSKLRILAGAPALLQQNKSHNVPGAGIDPFQPFEAVLKDGFMRTTCVKDYMYYRGDKYGDGWASYKLGPVSNVSIVHYEEFVAKEDRQDMTQNVCFEFCRTVPNMGFFGIVNGRNCYCTPYFTPMESDSSECDEVCEGDNTNMCGGKSKSSIYAMHMCSSTGEDLRARQATALGMKANMEAKLAYALGVSKILQESGEHIQKRFGPVGDSQATDLGQAEKVFAGELEHLTEVAEDIAGELGSLSNTPVLKDFTDSATVILAERVMEAIDDMLEEGEGFTADLDRMLFLAEAKSVLDAAKQYYPVMYFVDKKFADVPSTCTGDLVGKPMVASKDSCAAACDAHIHSCVGYQFFGSDDSDAGTCHLFSNFKTAFYYTGCDQKKASFLQTSKGKQCEAGCFAKFSKFEGTTLAPNPSGKCKQCLKEVTKRERCYDCGYDHPETLPPVPTTMAPTTAAPTTIAAPTPAPPTPAPPPPAPPPTTPAPTPPSQAIVEEPEGIIIEPEPPTIAPTARPTRPPTTAAPVTTSTADPKTGWCGKDCGEVDCDLRITNTLAPYPTTCIHCTESACKSYPVVYDHRIRRGGMYQVQVLPRSEG